MTGTTPVAGVTPATTQKHRGAPVTTYTPTDEQIEALAVAQHNYNWSPDMWGDAHPEHQADYRAEWKVLTASPAFQAIIRAAQAEAWRAGQRAPVLATDRDNPYITHATPNAYAEPTITDAELATRTGHLYNPDNGEQYGKAEL